MNLVDCFKTSHLIVLSHDSHSLHLSPESTWTRLIVWILDSSSDYPIQPSTGRTSTCSMFEYSTTDHPLPSSPSISSPYVNMLNYLKICHLIILPNSIYPSLGRTWTRLTVWIPPQLITLYHLPPSPGRTWTCSIVWIFVIWLSYPILSIRLQGVREL